VVFLHVLILWGLVVLALTVAYFIERRRKKRGDDEKPEYGVAQSFVASSYGLLLGLLVAFGANHHSDVRQQAQNEADSMIALWQTVNVYPRSIRDRTQHEIWCYMHSIVADDWPSMERGDSQESDRTGRFGDQLRLTVSKLPQDGGEEGSAYGRAQGITIDLSKSRQQLLFFTQPRVPGVLWAVIYVGAFLLFLLIALHYADRPRGRLVSLGAVVTLLTVVVTTLSLLDQPYGVGARVGPTAMQHAIELLNFQNKSTGVFGPCSVPPEVNFASAPIGPLTGYIHGGPSPIGRLALETGAWGSTS
jgi:hypothetical protein